jgi:hypothetical protein
MELNKFASRSFNDLTQYPVFPWVLKKYHTETIDLEDPESYRDFSKPVGAIIEEKQYEAETRFENSKDTDLP